MATIAVVLALGTGGAYAADTIGSSDVIDDSLLSQDIKNGRVARVDMANDSVIARTVLDQTLTGVDILDRSIEGDDLVNSTIQSHHVRDDELLGADISEPSLRVDEMGCQAGKVTGFARVKGASVSSVYTDSADAVDRTNNCALDNVPNNVTVRRLHRCLLRALRVEPVGPRGGRLQ